MTTETNYVIIGEYPDTEEFQQLELPRDDLKVLDFCNTYEDAQSKVSEFENEGYSQVRIVLGRILRSRCSCSGEMKSWSNYVNGVEIREQVCTVCGAYFRFETGQHDEEVLDDLREHFE